jgi:hypothetical protein
MSFFGVLVLIELLVEVEAGLAALVDQAKLELVEMFGAKTELAWRMAAGFHFAVNGGCGFLFLTMFLIAHNTLPISYLI